MPDHEENQSEMDKSPSVTMEERWLFDEQMQRTYGGNYQILQPQCSNCRFAIEGKHEECQKYPAIPWDIMTVQLPCPYYRRPKDRKPQIRCITVVEKKEILEYDFLPEAARFYAKKYPALAVWAYVGKEPVCGAVFTKEFDNHGALAVLQYVYTLEAYRNLGVAADVIKYAEKVCQQSKVEHMAVFLEEEQLEPFFIAIGWEQEPCDYQKLEYFPQSVMSEHLKAFVADSKEGVLRLTPDVRRILLLKNQRIPLELKECLKDDGVSENSLIYAPNDQLEGAVILEKKTGYQMHIRFLFMNPECSDKTILLRLLAAVFGNRENWSGSGNVLISVSEQKTAKLINYLFGKPNKQVSKRRYRNRDN